MKYAVYNPKGAKIAAFVHAEDAAMFVSSAGDGYEVKIGSKTVWTEGSEDFLAGESYDRAAEVMWSRE